MSSRTRRTLVATAPDGTEVTEQTSGGYTVAGLIQHTNGSWVIAAHGNSWDSVKNRTSVLYGRGYYKAFHVSDLTEATAPILREYFSTHAVAIDQLWRDGKREGLTEAAARGILGHAGAGVLTGGAIAAAREGHCFDDQTILRFAGIGVKSLTFKNGKFAVELKGGWFCAWEPAAGYATMERPAIAAGASTLRQLARDGWTSVSVRVGNRIADFQMSEIIKSLNARS